MHALVWFRADLRVGDNTALHHACRDADRVRAVFLVAPAQWREHHWGATRVEFVMRNVVELRRGLAARGITLDVVEAPGFADAPRAIVERMRDAGCDALYLNREYEVNERRRDRAVQHEIEKNGWRFDAFDDQTVLPPDRIETGAGEFYKVFTPYKRAWMREIESGSRPRPLDAPRPLGAALDVSGEGETAVEGYAASSVSPSLWPAGEDEARRRLDRFVDGAIERYADDRDFPAIDGTSTLSPYLAVGAVSARQCLAAAVDVNTGWLDGGRPGVDTWISELIWREFYRHVLVGFPWVSMNRPFKRETEAIEWCDDDALFESWCEGRTGVPIVDAAMRQLREIGWMHNRLRMIVAMYLSKDLFLDWRRGERFFMEQLIDGDLASNNGGWQWSASTGCDAAPYFRIFNPVSQSRRFDADGRFILRYCPELADLSGKALHDPSSLPPIERAALDYPEPLVDHAFARERALAAFKNLG